MEFPLNTEEQAFRQEVRDFLRDNLPAATSRRVKRLVYLMHGREMVLEWMNILHRKGWSAPNWPEQYGGTGWTEMQRYIFEEECWIAGAPAMPMTALTLVAPVIYTYGTEAQKARFLPPILKGDVWWCQGFSEPNSGSDLASLRTTAKLAGDHYIVNGTKIWTGGAHHADWGFFLVRTNSEVKAQKGISFLLIDMRSPGVTVRPIISINGDHHLNQVFLDNVHVPADQLVGEPGKGWDYAKFLLENERTASAFINPSKRELTKLHEIASGEMRNGKPLLQDPEFARRLARLTIEVQALEYSVLRVLTGEKTTYHSIAVASVLKLHGSDLQQKLAELQVDMLGPKAMRAFTPEENDDPDLFPADVEVYAAGRMSDYLIARAATIYGGSQQVQLGIIAKLAFGL